MYDSMMARWLEEQGYEVDYLTQDDLHFNTDALSGYKCVRTCGHDEYWSRPMRDDPKQNTHAFEAQSINWPPSTTFGVNGCRGVYSRLGGSAPRSSGGFTVYRNQHWAFEGTDLYYGDVFGVFGIRQFFYDDHLELGIGKVFPGIVHTESAYTANNSQTFSSKVISSSAIGGYFEAIGLGANLKYSANEWFVQGGFSDAKAESEFDFSSLDDDVLA